VLSKSRPLLPGNRECPDNHVHQITVEHGARPGLSKHGICRVGFGGE